MNSNYLITLTIACIASLLVGCGTSEDNTEENSPERVEAAQENCQRLISNYCIVIEDCSWFTSKSMCETEARQE
jgi:hypothetical protein